MAGDELLGGPGAPNLKIEAVYHTAADPNPNLPSYILYGMGIIFKSSISDRYLGIAAGYNNCYAIGWGETTTLTWKQL